MKKTTTRQKLSEHDQEIMLKTVACLEEGSVILYPTDTVWGLGCDATNDEAVTRLRVLKNRSSNKAMLVLLEEDRKLTRYVEEIPEVAWDILDASEKPITIIYPKGKNVSKNICAEDGSIGIRIIKDDFFLTQVLRKFKKPIVSTSANISNRQPSNNLEFIDQEIKDGADYIVKIQSSSKPQKPSSIIKLGLHGDVKIIRE